MKTYKIVRLFFKGEKLTIRENLTLEEAQNHCQDPETSSRTCTSKKMKKYTEENGEWFDAYYEE